MCLRLGFKVRVRVMVRDRVRVRVSSGVPAQARLQNVPLRSGPRT